MENLVASFVLVCLVVWVNTACALSVWCLEQKVGLRSHSLASLDSQLVMGKNLLELGCLTGQVTWLLTRLDTVLPLARFVTTDFDIVVELDCRKR